MRGILARRDAFSANEAPVAAQIGLTPPCPDTLFPLSPFVARALLLFAGALVSRYRASDPARAETFANFVAVCTTAHAMRSGAARYGALVLERERG